MPIEFIASWGGGLLKRSGHPQTDVPAIRYYPMFVDGEGGGGRQISLLS